MSQLILFAILFIFSINCQSIEYVVRGSNHTLKCETIHQVQDSTCTWIHANQVLNPGSQIGQDCHIELLDANEFEHNGLWTCNVGTRQIPNFYSTEYIVKVIDRPAFNFHDFSGNKVSIENLNIIKNQ